MIIHRLRKEFISAGTESATLFSSTLGPLPLLLFADGTPSSGHSTINRRRFLGPVVAVLLPFRLNIFLGRLALEFFDDWVSVYGEFFLLPAPDLFLSSGLLFGCQSLRFSGLFAFKAEPFPAGRLCVNLKKKNQPWMHTLRKFFLHPLASGLFFLLGSFSSLPVDQRSFFSPAFKIIYHPYFRRRH